MKEGEQQGAQGFVQRGVPWAMGRRWAFQAGRQGKAEAVSGTSLSVARARRAGGAGFPKCGVLTRQQSRQRAASRERPLLAAAARRAKAAGKRRVRVRV